MTTCCPAATCGQAPQTAPVTGPQAGRGPQAAAAAAAAASLDTQETSVGLSANPNVHAGQCPAMTGDQAFRHGGWEPIRSLVRQALFRVGERPARIESFDQCGACAWIEKSDDADARYRLRGNYCHDRLCTPCANERSARLRDALRATMANKKHTFITLTLCGRNETLRELVDRLYRSFRYLRSSKLWQEHVTGGAAFLEIKWSDKAGRWHPHLHIICESSYMDQGHLSDAWRSITRDSFIVDIRRVKDARIASSYVAKYASKPLNMTFAHVTARLDEAVLALKGRRLCLTFGTWYGIPLDPDIPEESESEMEFLHWHKVGGLYELHTKACAGDAGALAALEAVNAYGRAERFRPSLSG